MFWTSLVCLARLLSVSNLSKWQMKLKGRLHAIHDAKFSCGTGISTSGWGMEDFASWRWMCTEGASEAFRSCLGIKQVSIFLQRSLASDATSWGRKVRSTLLGQWLSPGYQWNHSRESRVRVKNYSPSGLDSTGSWRLINLAVGWNSEWAQERP